MHAQSSARIPMSFHESLNLITSKSLLRAGEVHARYRVVKENTDLLDRLVDVPMTKQECGQVLGYYMRHVYALSPAGKPGEHRDENDMLANARRELSALLQHDLDPVYFQGAARAGWQMHCREAQYPLADGYEMWSDAELTNELIWCIDCLIEDVNR